MWSSITSWCSGRRANPEPQDGGAFGSLGAPADGFVRGGCSTACMQAVPLACNERLRTQISNDKELLTECTAGNTESIQALIANRANVNVTRPPECKTPLHYLAHAMSQDAVGSLLLHKADPNQTDRDNRTPVHVAALNGHDDMLELLVRHKGDLNVMDDCDQTPLHFACIAGNLSMVQWLVEHGSAVEVETTINLQALHYASLSGWPQIVAYLLFTGDAEVDTLGSEDQQSPLHCAASRGHCEVVQLLLERKANCDIENQSRATPLHHAAMGNHMDVCVALLNAQANPAVVAENGWTPSLMAYRQGHAQCGKLLEYHLTRHEAQLNADARNKAHKLVAMSPERRAAELIGSTSKEKAAVLKAIGNISFEDRAATLSAMSPEEKETIHKEDAASLKEADDTRRNVPLDQCGVWGC